VYKKNYFPDFRYVYESLHYTNISYQPQLEQKQTKDPVDRNVLPGRRGSVRQ